MATTTTGNVTSASSTAGSTALGILADSKFIAAFQPNLYYEQLAEVKVIGQGNYTDRFFMFDQIATASVSTLTEGTSPAGLAASVTAKDILPTQYGLAVELTDLVVATSAIDLIEASAMHVGQAMARKLDQVIQVIANAGTNVLYGGAAANRAALAATDVMTYALFTKSGNKLKKNSAPVFADGFYRAILTIDQVNDLMNTGAAGTFVDIMKYASPDKVLTGEVGMLGKVRVLQSGNVSTFASTTTVHPALFAGKNGLRVTYWLPSKVKTYIVTPETASIANPLGQKGSVGAKANMGVSRVREEALVRAETGASIL